MDILELDRVDVSLARSAAYGLLAAAFQYPREETVQELRDDSAWSFWPDVVGSFASDVTDPLERAREIIQLPGAKEALQLAYARLFGHTARGMTPMYELEFGRGEVFQKSADLADLQGFYHAFGLELAPGDHERADHLTIECDFMNAMCVKEAYASGHEIAEGLEVLLEAQRSFLESHLAHWLPSFARMVREQDPEGFYGAIAGFAIAFIATESARMNVRCGPQLLELRNTDQEQESTIECLTKDFGKDCSLNPPR